MVGKKIDLEIKELKAPDLDAYLVAHNIAEQLERRISYQRAMKRAIQQAMRQGALGVRVEVAGRLSGAEMARAREHARRSCASPDTARRYRFLQNRSPDHIWTDWCQMLDISGRRIT
jgi:hypothetical protein